MIAGRTILGAALLSLGLSGCASFPGMPDLGSFLGGGPANRLALFDGSLTAIGPEGFCPARGASRPADGFAVLAPCHFIARGGAAPATLGLITIQAGPVGSAAVEGAEEAMAGLLQSEAGGALIEGEIDQVSFDNNLVVVQFEDSADTAIAGAQSSGWRGFTDIRDRLVTYTVRGTAADPITAEEGAALLNAMGVALRGENS